MTASLPNSSTNPVTSSLPATPSSASGDAVSVASGGGEPRVCLVAITKHGAAQAARLAAALPQAQVCTSAKFAEAFAGLPNTVRPYEGALRDQIAPLFAEQDQLIFFVSLGAVVRLIAPHLRDKDVDPGVIVVDDAGQYVIPVLSGHVGGANEWSERVADLIGGAPVLTTASDVGKTIPVDILGRHLGWRVEAPKINITRVSAHVVNGEPIAFVQEAGSPHWWTRPTPLPATVHRFDRFEAVDLSRFAAVLWVTHAPVPASLWEQLHERLVVYRPPLDNDMAATGAQAVLPVAPVAPTAPPASPAATAPHGADA